MWWLLLACAPGTDSLRSLVVGGGEEPPPVSDDSGCVWNESSQSGWRTLQEAFDAAQDGDQLSLCAGSLAAGASTDKVLHLDGGVVLGDVVLGGGSLVGIRVQDLSIGDQDVRMQAVIAGSVVVAGALLAEELEVEELVVEGPAEVGSSQLGSLSAAAALTLADSQVEGELSIHGAEAWLAGVSLGSLRAAGAVVEGEALTLAGGLQVDGGAVELLGLELEAGPDAVSLREGRLVLRDAWIHETSASAEGTGIVGRDSELVLEGVRLQGFGDGSLSCTRCEVEVDGLEFDAPISMDGGRLEGTGLTGSILGLSGACEADLSEVSLEQLTQLGGSLELRDASLGGVVGTAVALEEVEARFTDVLVSEVDAHTLTFPLPDGGYTQTTDGGVGIELSGGSLEISGLNLEDMPYGLRSEDAAITGAGLTVWRSWQAGLQITGGSLELEELWVGEGRGWGLLSTDAELSLRGPVFTALQHLRRKTSVYDDEGTWQSEATTISPVPAVATRGGAVLITGGTFLDLDGYGVDWSGEAQALLLSTSTFDEVDYSAITLQFTHPDASALLSDLTVRTAGLYGLLATGDGMGRLELRDFSAWDVAEAGIVLRELAEARGDAVDVDQIGGTGVQLSLVPAFVLEDWTVSDVGGSGFDLSTSVGSLTDGRVARTEGVALLLRVTDLALDGFEVNGAQVGLSCDASTALDPCQGVSLSSVVTALSGCPEECLDG